MNENFQVIILIMGNKQAKKLPLNILKIPIYAVFFENSSSFLFLDWCIP
jgi:hypothetical protein